MDCIIHLLRLVDQAHLAPGYLEHALRLSTARRDRSAKLGREGRAAKLLRRHHIASRCIAITAASFRQIADRKIDTVLWASRIIIIDPLLRLLDMTWVFRPSNLSYHDSHRRVILARHLCDPLDLVAISY